MSEIEITEALQQELGRLFVRGLKISVPMGALQEVREKLSRHGYQETPDKGDILDELAQLEQLAGSLNREAGKIRRLLETQPV